MKLRYEQLFNIGITADYYVDDKIHDDFAIEPTRYCQKQMSRYRILSRKTPDGIALLYECDPLAIAATPFKPISTTEKFTFTVKVSNPDFWYFADVNDWEKDKVYFLKNPFFNSTGDISILSGALAAPIAYRPMEFMYEVPLENNQGLLEIRDATGVLVKTTVVRAKTTGEPVGKKESYFIDLKNYTDGLYTLRHVSSGGNVDEQVYCSADYTTGTLALIEISYQGGAWTGVAPFQKYTISISSRLADWFFDVHVAARSVPVALPSQLSIKHIPTLAEPLSTFSVVGMPDDLNGFVQFKSNAKIRYSQKPMHLQLLKTVTGPPLKVTTMFEYLPLPSSVSIQKDAFNNLFTKIIVNL